MSLLAAVVMFSALLGPASSSATAQSDPPYVPPFPPTGAVITPSGVVVAVQASLAGGWLISTPCTEVGVITEGTFVPRADVVLDPGHGGSESGAVGSNGIVERDLNLEISERVDELLSDLGFAVTRTRTQDYRLPIRSRADIANALAPSVFVSIHHNGGALANRSTPGSEVYFQPGDDQSSRLATLMWDENFRAMSAFGSSFVGAHYAGTVTRVRADGEPLHGVLRYTPDLVSVITEPLYLSNPPEAALLARADVREAEAQAITNAIVRWFADESPVDAKYTAVEDGSSTGTGGTDNCTDPDLGTPLLAPGSLPASTTSAYVPVTPERLFDTRFGPGSIGRLSPGETIDIDVTGAAGVPAAGVSAIALNVTATEARAPGYVTVWPKGYPQPLASNLNLVTAQTAANMVIVPVGVDGSISLYSQSGTHLVGDVLGYFVSSSEASSGRYVAVEPTRLFDSRDTEPIGPDGSTVVPMAGEAPLPAAGMSAVVVNMTATEAAAAGFVTAWPSGVERPLASTLNLAGPGDEVANLAIVPVGADGAIELYSQRGAELVVDVVGYFTDATADSAESGLFVALTPGRLADTRTDAAPSGYVDRRGTTTVQATAVAGIPDEGAAAIVTNLTAAASGGEGYLTVWPSGSAQPEVSNLNVGPNETRPNAAVVGLGADGAVSVYVHSGAHVIVDASGYFTG